MACVYILKAAVEKAIPEIDKRLTTEIDLRKHARSENRRYCDPVVLTYQAERMPEQIRLKVGVLTMNIFMISGLDVNFSPQLSFVQVKFEIHLS